MKLNLNYLTPLKKVISTYSWLTLALGYDEETEWSTATARKRKRAKKDDDEDEDYVVSAQPKPVNEDGVAKIMSTLLQARERWVINKLLNRLQVL